MLPHNLKAAGSNPAPATKFTSIIEDFKAEQNARLLSFQILVNTWSTFYEAPLRGGLLRSGTKVSRQDYPGTDPSGASARAGSSRCRCRRCDLSPNYPPALAESLGLDCWL
jgi:hypothetical protein